jgi:hypothetical protein
VWQEEETQQRKDKTHRGSAWGWTGFGDKTAWDWMQLLIVPVVLAVVALLFNLSLNARQQEPEERRAAAQIEAEPNARRKRGYRRTWNRWGRCSSTRGCSIPKKTTRRVIWRERARWRC